VVSGAMLSWSLRKIGIAKLGICLSWSLRKLQHIVSLANITQGMNSRQTGVVGGDINKK